MNKKLDIALQRRVSALARAENEDDLIGMASAHKAIQKTVKAIYNEKIDIPTVLRTEQILNDGHGNVVDKTQEARKTHEMLVRQAATGEEIHNKFQRNPKLYVEYADDTRKEVQRGRPTADGIPFEPIRSSLTEFRNQLVTEVSAHRSKDPFTDRKETNLLRIEATAKAERDFLERFIDNRKLPKQEREKQKEQTLERFDKRIGRELQKTRPEREQEAPKGKQPF